MSTFVICFIFLYVCFLEFIVCLCDCAFYFGTYLDFVIKPHQTILISNKNNKLKVIQFCYCDHQIIMNSGKTIIESYKGSTLIVQFNRPQKKNALDINMYHKVTEILSKAAENVEISAVVLTGTGDFYSSGNDLSNSSLDYMKLMIALRNFIRAFILFPKTLIAIVNGPAIGIAATTLAFCDLVFASEHSYFYTPFTKLGVVAEGCSSVTFSRIMGERKAREMLLYNHKMYAKEALECGFINCIYKTEELQNKVWNKITEVTGLSPKIIAASKRLIRDNMHEDLLRINDNELDEIIRIKSSQMNVEFESVRSRL